MTDHHNLKSYAHLYVGLEVQSPVLDGTCQPYVNLDNAASTPAFKRVQETVNDFLLFYSSVHRGTGFKSQLSTYAYEQARQIVMQFVGASPEQHVCIFGKNTTEATNKLARRFPFSPERDVVLVSLMEHHSNDLPWRSVAKVVHVNVTPDGQLDEADFDARLKEYAGRVALVAITGASNVTGVINPIHRLAEKAHAAGAQIVVDCAQLAPHRAIDIRPLEDPSHLDYVALSAHKLYAPFGAGALIGRRDTFERGDPDLRGGGEVEIVTVDQVYWSEPPERDEAGSPNTVGAVAMAAALRQLQEVGMQTVAEHEAALTAYALYHLNRLPGVRIFGSPDPRQASHRLGVIPFAVEGLSHFLVAAILGYEFGIGVRNGCFCAHPYLLHLFGLQTDQEAQVRSQLIAGDRTEMPGLVRVSFGLYNDASDVDSLVEALQKILRREWRGSYVQDKASGEFHPTGYRIDFSDYFNL